MCRVPFVLASTVAVALGVPGPTSSPQQEGVASSYGKEAQELTLAPGVIPDEYVVDFVSTAAFGVDLNGTGTVIGTSYPDPGCGSFCLPPLEAVAWRSGRRIVLPALPGFTGITARAVDSRGWIVGYAGSSTVTRAVAWRPIGLDYEIVDLGALPGKPVSEAIGIDEQGRVIGWSTTTSFPPATAPFLWTEEGGLVDLGQLGYPNEKPVAISPGGTVTTATTWYPLGSPGSVAAMAPAPSGFLVGAYPAAINDRGDQARFLVTVGGQNLVYLYRYHRNGTWQRLSNTPTGRLTRYGIGSIDEDGTVTATVSSTGVIAFGPTGLAQSLVSLLSPAWVYPDVTATAVTTAGPRNEKGEILAAVLLGRSPRLVRLKPAPICRLACMRIDDLSMDARFIPDPSAPGSCSSTLSAHDEVSVQLRLTTPEGAPLASATVVGRFLDDYWTSARRTSITDARGYASFSYTGTCGVGAIEFLVENARLGERRLDRDTGTLSIWQIPVQP